VIVCVSCLLWWLFFWGCWVLALVMGMDGMTICFPFTTIAIATRGRTYQASIHPDFWVFDRSWGQLVPDHEIRSQPFYISTFSSNQVLFRDCDDYDATHDNDYVENTHTPTHTTHPHTDTDTPTHLDLSICTDLSICALI
jgi:hypothetical protein